MNGERLEKGELELSEGWEHMERVEGNHKDDFEDTDKYGGTCGE